MKSRFHQIILADEYEAQINLKIFTDLDSVKLRTNFDLKSYNLALIQKPGEVEAKKVLFHFDKVVKWWF